MFVSERNSAFRATLKLNLVEQWRWQLPSCRISNLQYDVKQHKNSNWFLRVPYLSSLGDTSLTISSSFMPHSRPSVSFSSRQLRSHGTRPGAKGGFGSDAPSTPESEESFGLAAKENKHRCGVDSGQDDSGMEVLPMLSTQHDVGVDADISSEGQADIVVDGSPSPSSQDSPSSQYSYGMNSAPLPEGLDFDMGLTPPLGAPDCDVVDVPQPKEPDEHFNNPSAAKEDVTKDDSAPEPVRCITHWYL